MSDIKIAILFIVFLLSSCRAYRQDYKEIRMRESANSEIDYKKKYESQLELNARMEEEIAALTAENVRLSSEINTHDIEYDTDKPVDPVTKTPPKRRETIQTNRMQSESFLNTSLALHSNSYADYSLFIRQIDELEAELSVKKKELEDYKSSFKSRAALDVWWFWISAGAGFVLLIRYLFKRRLLSWIINRKRAV